MSKLSAMFILLGLFIILFGFCLYAFFKKYHETKHRHFLYNSCILGSALFMVLGFIFQEIGGILYWSVIVNSIFYFSAKWSLLIIALFYLLIYETMSREGHKTIIYVIWSIMTTIVIVLDIIWLIYQKVYLFDSNAPFMEVLDIPSDFCYYFLISSILLMYIPFAIKIRRNAPENLRKYASIHLLGAILGGISFPLWEIDRILPSIEFFDNTTGIEALLFIGITLILISQYKKPQLAYVLPFKAQRITVVDTNSGMPLFSHYWRKDEEAVDEILFSGMIQGVSGIINESARKGDIKNINLDEGVLIIERIKEYPVAFVLVSNKSSISLEDSLNNFSAKFIEKYSQHFGKLNDGKNYADAINIISECFSFIPDYS